MEVLSARQLAGWISYSRLEPFGEERADLRSANICQILAETNRNPKKRTKPFTTKDFMPDFLSDEDEKPVQSADEMKKILGSLVKK